MERILRYFGAYHPHPTEQTGERIPVQLLPGSVEESPSCRDFIHVKRVENPETDLLILYLYGNGDDVVHATPFLEALSNRSGASCVTFDYPQYGASTGYCSEAAIMAVCDAVIEWIREQYPEHRLIIWGKSLGSVFASYIASATQVHAVVLQAPLCSAVRWGCRTRYSMACGQDAFQTLERAELYSSMWGRILLIHGDADEVTPIWHSRDLLAICQENNAQAKLAEIKGRGHNNIQFAERYDQFEEHVLQPLLGNLQPTTTMQRT